MELKTITSLPRILVKGRFKPEDLRVSVSESTRKIEQSIENQLEDIWLEKVKMAKEKGKNCYNGISYRLNSLKKEGGTLFLDFGTLEYKVRDGLIDIPEYYDLPEDYYRKGCFTSASIKTSDGKYLMVELSGKSMNQNNIDLIGGIMETDISMTSGEDIFISLYKELEEEAGIETNEIKDISLHTIYLEQRTNIGLYFEIILNVSSEKLLERFKTNKDIDIKSLCVYSKEEYLEVLKNHRSLNKRLTAELLSI